jgi:hypothetical protein
MVNQTLESLPIEYFRLGPGFGPKTKHFEKVSRYGDNECLVPEKAVDAVKIVAFTIRHDESVTLIQSLSRASEGRGPISVGGLDS